MISNNESLDLSFRSSEPLINEIVAIPRLPDMLAIEGAIVTINAMGASDRRAATGMLASKVTCC